MTAENNTPDLTLEELRELVPQLQQVTEKYKRSETIQKALFKISELASSIYVPSNLYASIHDIIGSFIPAQNFLVAFYEEQQELIDLVYFVDKFDEQMVSQVSADDLKNSITGYVLRSGEHLFLTQETFAQRLNELSVKHLGASPVDWIGVPLKRGSQVIGAMVVQSYDDSIRYTDDDLEVLLFISQHIVNCVDRVTSRELTEQTIRQRTKQLRQINEELQEEISERQKAELLQYALFEISELSVAASDRDTDSFYAAIHDILARLIGAPNCYIAIIDDETQLLHFPYYKDLQQAEIKARTMGSGLTEYVIRHGKAALIDASSAYALYEQHELSKSVTDNIQAKANSWIGAPLIVDNKIKGVIAVQSYGEEKKYNVKDLEFLRFVSHHIAESLGRKQSSDAILAYNQRLASEVKDRTEELRATNVFLQRQIEERQQAQLQLEHDAHHDGLTGLANRVLFNSRLELALANKKRFRNHNFAVIFIDLDRFKQINDSVGHLAGDHFLREVASRIDACIRGYDLLARLGGDEFLVLFDSFESSKDIEEISSRIISSIAKPFTIDNKEIYSGASIGIAYLEKNHQTAEEVVRDADAAMYHAKSLGRGRYVIFDKTMREKLLDELEIEGEFRKTLDTAAFDSFAQPIFSLLTQQPLYDECYIRWEHSNMGRVQREQFWQIAEHCGLTVEIDQFMLNKACTILLNWQKGSKLEQQKLIAINLSIYHLRQQSLAQQLIDQLLAKGVDPKKLVIEYDENALNLSSESFLPAIETLKKAGITLVLDNFGSGLASLSYLYSYPFDYVKMDHSFIKTLPSSERNLKLIQSVLSISEHLKFKLIAEGIATAEQHQALLAAGCEFGQGKYLQKSEIITLNQHQTKPAI
jgi:diguanylate cyclase (GGDEF)-like protein